MSFVTALRPVALSLGVLVGLHVAAVAQIRALDDKSDPVVAIVDGGAIYRSDLAMMQRALPAQFQHLLEVRRGHPEALYETMVSLAGALTLTYELGAELLNFGAFIGFIGVNLAAFLRAWRVRSYGAIAPACGVPGRPAACAPWAALRARPAPIQIGRAHV